MKTKLSMAAAAAALLVGMPSVAADHNLKLTGHVPQSCSVSPNNVNLGFNNLGNIGDVEAQDFEASFFCNVRFDASLASENGRLLNVDADVVETEGSGNHYAGAGAQPNTYAALDYTVTSSLFGTEVSSDWGAGDSIDADDLAPMSGGPVSFEVDFIELAGATDFLVAGNYRETLTLTISPLGW